MFTDLTHRLRSLVRRRAVEQQLDDELRFHRERLVDRYVADGLPHDEAMRRARLEMGGFDQAKEEHRDVRGVRLLEDLVTDLRYAVRQFARSRRSVRSRRCRPASDRALRPFILPRLSSG